MQEGDAAAAGPAPGGFIDEAVPGGSAAGQRGVEVRDAVADVVDSGAPASEKLGNGTRRIDRFEQLDVHVAESQTDDTRAVRGLGRAGNEAEDVTIERQGLGEARHGNADVG
jgi:hypothetical protein